MRHWIENGFNFCEPDSVDEWLELIEQIAFDYDGYNKSDNLKSLIDEIVDMVHNARVCLDRQPAAYPWHMVEEPPKEDGWYMLCYLSKWEKGNWWVPEYPDYWMAAMPPKEDV